MTVAQKILKNLKQNPEQVAICLVNGKSIRNRDLLNQILCCADQLKRIGVRPGQRVLFQVTNGIRLVTSFVATMLIGAVPVLADPSTGNVIYRKQIEITAPDWLILEKKLAFLYRFPVLRSLLCALGLPIPEIPPIASSRWIFPADTKECSTNLDADTFSPNEEVFLQLGDAALAFTGGTTREPKCVRYTQKGLWNFMSNVENIVSSTGVTRYLADNPQQLLYALFVGKTVHLATSRKSKRASFLYKTIMDGSVDAYFGSPYLWKEVFKLCEKHRSPIPHTLRAIFLGSAPVTREFLAELGQWVHEDTAITSIYGLTEAGPVCTITAQQKLAWSGEGDLVGETIDGYVVEIAREAGDQSGIGEVVIYGKSLFSGYLYDIPRNPGDGFHTGDLGRLVRVDNKEMLVLTGRKKDMIIRKGVNIYPVMVETLLLAYRENDRCPVRDCAIIGIWNPESQDEETVLCFVAARKGFDEKDAADMVDIVLGDNSLIDHYLSLLALPVTGRQNKIDRKELHRIVGQKFPVAENRP